LRCTRENHAYKVLFSRDPIELPAPPPPVLLEVGAGATASDSVPPPVPAPTLTGMFCTQHPNVPAAHQCKSCGTFLCATCDFAFSDGTHLCGNCAAKQPPAASVAPPRLALVGMRCSHHRNVQATQQCKSCGAYLCDTCDFAFPDGTHLCAACATKPSSELAPKQKQSMIWSYICAGGATAGFIGGMVVARTAIHQSREALQAVGFMFLFFVLLPAAAGIGLGFGATRRGHPSPWSVRGAIIWNAFLLGVFLLLSVIGNMK